MTAYAPGELRAAVLGELARRPGISSLDLASSLEVSDPNVIRVTLRRMRDRDWVREVSPKRWMLTTDGRNYVRRLRAWLQD